jgi:hypothetical protein
MAVDVSTASGFKAGVPRKLFQIGVLREDQAYRWDMTADGKRFLIVTAQSMNADAPITVVTNWLAELKK